MTNAPQNRMANRLDTVAHSNGDDQITLTRYNPLQSSNRYVVIRPEGPGDLANQQRAIPSVKKTDENQLTRTWTSEEQNHQKEDQTNRSLVENIFNGINSSEKDFQIVWTGLSFRVGMSKYDQLVSASIDGARSLFDIGSYFSRRKSAQQSDNMKTDDLFGSQSPLENDAYVSGKTDELSHGARTIFDSLNGYIKSGELSAILGPSGAGKTSLLNALCGRTENYGGRIQLIGGGSRRMRLSIIPQKDYLIENLTVRENLLYSSRLLNPGKNFDHEGNIRRVVQMLNLVACFKSVVANISGGEYKRVSIAQELLRQPDILVLDEPTSGLDSLNCVNLIESLRKLISASQEGLMKPIAIVMTIHQPDVELFHMFDHIYCMARHGRVIYDGHPRDTLQVIRSQANLTSDQRLASKLAGEGGSSGNSFGAMINPANLLIEIASEISYGQEIIDRLAAFNRKQFEHVKGSLDSRGLLAPGIKELRADLLGIGQKGEKVSRKISCSPSEANPVAFQQPLANGDKPQSSRSGLIRDGRLAAKHDHSGLFWYHTGVLAQRGFLSSIHDPMMTIVSLAFYFTVPFIMWIVYPRSIGHTNGCPINQRELDIVSLASNKTADRLETLQDQVFTALENSIMFFLTTYAFSMCSMALAALAFPLSMHILLKEVRNGWYNLPTYVLAKTISNFPFEVLLPVLSFMMLYELLGMPSSEYEWRLWAMASVIVLVSMISTTHGLIFGSLCMDSVQTAIFLAISASLPQLVLNGFAARIRYMPQVLQKMSWLSQYRCSIVLMNIIRFGFNMCPCDDRTDEYLRTRPAILTDMPDRLQSTFIFYLNDSPSHSNESSVASNEQLVLAGNISNNITASGLERIPGVDYELMLNGTERFELLKRIDSKEIDLFGQMAGLISRSFAFGRKLEDCSSVRPQNLVSFDAPADDKFFLIMGWMFMQLLVGKLVLYLVVRHKIGSRI